MSSDSARSKADVSLSKRMSSILRHNAEKEGVPIRPDGFVRVDDLLSHRFFQGRTYEDIKRVVADCEKQRFKLMESEEGDLLIRANQGHSMDHVEIDMELISDASSIPVCVHGTYHGAWELIRSSGLSKMKRQHIHFAAGLPGDDGVISGMRKSAQILIYVDVHRAIQDGIRFFRSANNVILCEGDESGVLHYKYFSRVVNSKLQPLPDFVPHAEAASSSSSSSSASS